MLFLCFEYSILTWAHQLLATCGWENIPLYPWTRLSSHNSSSIPYCLLDRKFSCCWIISHATFYISTASQVFVSTYPCYLPSTPPHSIHQSSPQNSIHPPTSASSINPFHPGESLHVYSFPPFLRFIIEVPDCNILFDCWQKDRWWMSDRWWTECGRQMAEWRLFNLFLSCYLMDGEGQMADEWWMTDGVW